MKNMIYSKWLSNTPSSKYIADYLVKNGYCCISIYGFAEMGKQIYFEVKNCRDIVIEAIIDKTNSDDGMGLEVKSPFPELKDTTLIIVTALMDEDLIKILNKKYDIPYVTVQDLINAVGET